MTTPIHLSDAQMSAIFAASHPLPANQRGPFLEACAQALARLPEIGDGDVHRVVMATQKKFWDPPQFKSDAGASGAAGGSTAMTSMTGRTKRCSRGH
jgi:hypothetical protein